MQQKLMIYTAKKGKKQYKNVARHTHITCVL